MSLSSASTHAWGLNGGLISVPTHHVGQVPRIRQVSAMATERGRQLRCPFIIRLVDSTSSRAFVACASVAGTAPRAIRVRARSSRCGASRVSSRAR